MGSAGVRHDDAHRGEGSECMMWTGGATMAFGSWNWERLLYHLCMDVQ